MPTPEQAIAAVVVCQMLSNLLQDIVLFRYDVQTKEIYILTEDNIQVSIPSNGEWEFINE